RGFDGDDDGGHRPGNSGPDRSHNRDRGTDNVLRGESILTNASKSRSPAEMDSCATRSGPGGSRQNQAASRSFVRGDLGAGQWETLVRSAANAERPRDGRRRSLPGTPGW